MSQVGCPIQHTLFGATSYPHRHVDGPNLTGKWGGGMRSQQPCKRSPAPNDSNRRIAMEILFMLALVGLVLLLFDSAVKR